MVHLERVTKTDMPVYRVFVSAADPGTHNDPRFFEFGDDALNRSLSDADLGSHVFETGFGVSH